MLLFAPAALAASSAEGLTMLESGAITSWRGIACLAVFVIAYAAVVTEEIHHLRKSKPVIFAAGLIWLIIASGAKEFGFDSDHLHEAILHELNGFSQMFLFLLVAMTYVNTMNDRNVFAALRSWIVSKGLSYSQLFWVTGVLAFFLSAMVDNLISALLMGAVIMAIGASNRRFVAIACVNVVCAANAGGAFSPFGDITTLMVWQSGTLSFFEFFPLFLPSVATFIVPAFVMSRFVAPGAPEPPEDDVTLKRGGKRVCLLFMVTIALAVSGEQLFGLPPFMGMMTGMSLLMFFTYYISRDMVKTEGKKLDIYTEVGRAEWDTLLFFFGVIFSVGGLAFLGYLELANTELYQRLGPGPTNIIAGVFSAVVDNIPVMFSILSMDPEMDKFQWLLITLCVGVGGSLLSIGSAAGVGLMGIARGQYTFLGHLKWTPVIALGYAAGIGTHYLVNGGM